MAAYDVIPEPWRSQHRDIDQAGKVASLFLSNKFGRYSVPIDLLMKIGEETRKAHEVLVKARGGAQRREAAEADFVDEACRECGGEIEPRTGKGRRAVRCNACRVAAKPEPLAGTCRDCGDELRPHLGRGRSPVRCTLCREKAKVAEAAAKAAPVPAGTCRQCGDSIAPTTGRGRKPVRCAACRGLA